MHSLNVGPSTCAEVFLEDIQCCVLRRVNISTMPRWVRRRKCLSPDPNLKSAITKHGRERDVTIQTVQVQQVIKASGTQPTIFVPREEGESITEADHRRLRPRHGWQAAGVSFLFNCGGLISFSKTSRDSLTGWRRLFRECLLFVHVGVAGVYKATLPST